MKSKAYWTARAAALEEELQNGAEKLSEETIAEYERAIETINADIRDTFSAYVAMDIPEGEAVKMLNAAESDKTYAELMQLFEETTDTERRAEILARVNAQAYGARISRLEGVKSRILTEMTRVANTAVAAHKLFYTRTLQKSYYTNVYNIAKGLNCGIDFSLLPTRAIDAALREPWNGANYSDRIWNHNDRFTEAVQNTVTTGIMAGHSVNRMAAQLEEYVRSEGADGVLYSTTRLVRTETAHFMNTGQKAAYDEIGIKKYRFVAALSERTCETCGGLDGKVFDVADAREGVNYPPIHPNCRCTTVMADAISKTRIARDPATGKNYKVDGNMTFEEWQASLTPEQKAAMGNYVQHENPIEAKFDKKDANKIVQVSTPPISPVFQEVTQEYLDSAKPGEGEITYDDGYKTGKHQQEIKTAEWLRDTFGGDVKLMKEAEAIGVKTPDYLWRGKYWELKNTTTAKAADSAVRKAVQQIYNNPGGIILDYGDNLVDDSEIESIIKSRLKRESIQAVDIMIIKQNTVNKIYRHKK